ncbi:TPA: hypothetical protein NJ542_003011 [Vibrio parahaemolyticus]|nr:hypothetical protein [Vibrio parahaemolyticus]
MKYLYMLTGVVHPERADVNVTSTRIELGDSGDVINFSIYKSRIAFTVETSTLLNESGMNSLRLFAEEQVRTVVDSLGFLVGCGYDIEIIQCIEPQHQGHLIFGVEEKYLSELNYSELIEPIELVEILNSKFGAYLRRCLNDLRLAIRTPKDSAFYCYRAIECLIHYFLNNGTPNKSEAWQMFRENIGVSKEQIMYIKKAADPIRHGNPLEVQTADRQKVMMDTWAITMKFITFAKSSA